MVIVDRELMQWVWRLKLYLERCFQTGLQPAEYYFSWEKNDFNFFSGEQNDCNLSLYLTSKILIGAFTVFLNFGGLFFFTVTFGHFLLGHFGHLSHSCIKTRRNSLCFQTLWSKWLNFVRSFQIRFVLWPNKNRWGNCPVAPPLVPGPVSNQITHHLWVDLRKDIILKIVEKAMIAITDEKQMADVISGEFILNVVDPQFTVWRQGDVHVHVTSLSDQRDDVS